MLSPTSLSILGLALSSLAPSVLAGTPTCGEVLRVGPQGETAGGWKQAQWRALWDHRNTLCTDTHYGDFWYDKTINNVRIQASIKKGFSSKHCYDALATLIWKCFDTGHGQVAHTSASWNSDPDSHEWYWIDVPSENGWCPASVMKVAPCLNLGI